MALTFRDGGPKRWWARCLWPLARLALKITVITNLKILEAPSYFFLLLLLVWLKLRKMMAIKMHSLWWLQLSLGVIIGFWGKVELYWTHRGAQRGGGKERQTEGGDSNLGHLWWADRAALHLSCYSILHRRSPNDQTNDIDLTDTVMYRIMVSHRRAGEDTVVRYSGNKDRDSRGEDEKERSAEGKARKKIWENYLSVL